MIEVHEISALMNSVKRAIAESTGQLRAENEALRRTIAEMQGRLDVLASRPDIPGPPGKDATVDVSLIVEQVLQKIPTPKDGEPGKDAKEIDPVAVNALVEAEVARAVAALPPPKNGEPGKDAPPVDLVGLAADVLKLIPIPKDGRDGEDGRDAAEIHPIPMIDPEKSYPRGVWARHKGGLVRSDGIGGWDVMQNGLAGVDASQSESDQRVFRLSVSLTDAKVHTWEFRIPVQLYRGIFRADVAYEQGDTVTWDGSLWHCNAKTASGAPGKSQDWQLCVKRGNNGKGEKGDKGDPGQDGKPGKDLRYQ